MRPNKEGGNSDVSRNFLVMCKSHVAYHLKELLNFCITFRAYPTHFKTAQITPVYKKGSPRDIEQQK